MIFSTEQVQAIECGEAVPITVGQTECVVIRKEVYEKVRGLAYDDSELSDDELRAIASCTLNDLDSAGSIE